MSLFSKLAGVFVERVPNEKDDEVGLEDLQSLLEEEGVPDLLEESEVPAERAAIDYTLAEVYEAGSISQGRNTAPTVMKLLAGLVGLPEEHRLQAIRAMDAADEGWDEATVKADAAARIELLQRHYALITEDEHSRVNAEMQKAEKEYQILSNQVEELEERIAALQGERDQLRVQIADRDQQSTNTAEQIGHRAGAARGVVTIESMKLKKLLAFFD